MQDFVAIDFETANEQRSSPCSVGVVVFSNGEPTASFYSLIKPRDLRFSSYNTAIHGITPEDVRDEPEFPDVWPHILDLISNRVVVAHNASFDLSVIRHSLHDYALPFPTLEYSCSRLIAKEVWPGLISYRLALIARVLDIEFEHHHALADAKACAEIVHRACQLTGMDDLNQLTAHLGINHGRVFESGEYLPPHDEDNAARPRRTDLRKSSHLDIGSLNLLCETPDPGHPFFGRIIAFTGTLQCLSRNQAFEVVIAHGGGIDKGVTKQTNFLVVGDQDMRRFADGQTKSAKLRKAEKLLAKGQKIELVSEQDFLQMLGV